MSVLGNLLRSLFTPQKAEQAPAPQMEKHDNLLAVIAQAQLQLSVAREIRELLADPRYAAPGRLERHGFKVWSQTDEDGIIEEIFRRIGTATRSFVEFGVSHGRECNTLKLLVEGWRGLWMEPKEGDCDGIRRAFAARLNDGQLTLLQTHVTAENVCTLIEGARVASPGQLDLLSIDIDGNDYHVLKAAAGLRARVIVIEYNAKYPPPMDVAPPYEMEHTWDGTDYNGSSLQALANLAARVGYRLVGTGIAGVNAFFVRSDLAGGHFADGDAAALYNPARYWLNLGYVAGHPPGDHFGYTSDAELQGKSKAARQE